MVVPKMRLNESRWRSTLGDGHARGATMFASQISSLGHLIP